MLSFIQISKKLNYLIRDLIVAREDDRLITISESTKIREVPYFADGAILKVSSKNPKKESHVGIKTSDIEYNNSYLGVFQETRNVIILLEESASTV